MLVFGIGAATPLLVLGTLSRELMLKARGGLMSAGATAKTALGLMLVGVGLLVLSGLDKSVEATLVAAMPDWLTALTTRY